MMLEPLTRCDLIDITQRVLSENGSESELESLKDTLKQQIPNGNICDLIRQAAAKTNNKTNNKITAEQIVDAAIEASILPNVRDCRQQ